jgi:hypothetical protein
VLELDVHALLCPPLALLLHQLLHSHERRAQSDKCVFTLDYL